MLYLDLLTEDNLASEMRVVEIAPDQKTPVVLERFCWRCLEDAARRTNQSIAELCQAAAKAFPDLPIANAALSYVLKFLRDQGKLERQHPGVTVYLN